MSKDEFAKLGAVAYTLSTQDTASKKKFCERDSLAHTLLSDVGAKVAEAYGVKLGNGMARRVTFYINPKGKIVAVDAPTKVQNAAENALAMLKKLQEPKP